MLIVSVAMNPAPASSRSPAMSRATSILTAAVCLSLCSAAQARDPASAKWQSLFDGESLEGWEQHSGEAKYSIEEGCIVGTSVPNTGNSFLCTKKTYSDFIFECEFQVDPVLNSGIQFRSQFFEEATEIPLGDGKTRKVAADRVHGYQSEIDVEPGRNRMWSAGVYDEARRGWLYPGSRGGNGDEFSKQGQKVTNVEGWNKVRIECVGDSIKTFLNGEPRADFQDDLTPAGIIALQVHGVGNDESKVGKQVRWRNIRIKDLAGE
jgi:hypothetical protein